MPPQLFLLLIRDGYYPIIIIASSVRKTAVVNKYFYKYIIRLLPLNNIPVDTRGIARAGRIENYRSFWGDVPFGRIEKKALTYNKTF